MSRTGVLLCAPKPYGVIPFIEQTLLEIKLDLGTSWSNKPIEPLAKVVRYFTKGSGDGLMRFYGVRFVEFSHKDSEHWDSVLRNVEKASLADNDYGVAA